MRAIVFALLVAGNANAEPTLGDSASGVFADSVDAYYAKLSDDRVCEYGCTQEVVAEGTAGKMKVELRKTTAKYGSIYAVVFGNGGAWYAAEPLDTVFDETCSTGKCISQRVTQGVAREVGGVAWMTIFIHTTIDHETASGGRATNEADYQIAVGCKNDKCITVKAGSMWAEDGSLVIGRDRIDVREGGKTHAVALAW